MADEKLYTAAEMQAALCVWEAMLDKRMSSKEPESPFMVMWDGSGAYEMRDRATEIAVWIESLFEDSKWGDMTHPWRALCDALSFDWEIVPTLLDMIEWEGAGYGASWMKPTGSPAEIADRIANAHKLEKVA